MSKFINEIGNKYGKLTVISLSSKTDSKGQKYWNCLCDCGKECVVRGTSLRSGQTKSCGCLKANNREINELGNQYGDLLVIGKSDKRSNNHIVWICQCICGNICEISSSHLKERTCCNECTNKKKIINEIGNTYGELTVIEEAGRDKNRQTLWKCKCNCGKYIIVSGINLRNNKKLNCGCKRISSHGAIKIKELLIENNYNFIEEKTFDNCRFPDTNALARFDFYLPDINTIIEYDGPQHYGYTNHGWDTRDHFLYVQQHDKYKEEWCKINNIKLIRIPYHRSLNQIKLIFEELFSAQDLK